MVDEILLTPAELAPKMGTKVGWVYRRTRQGAVNPLPALHVISSALAKTHQKLVNSPTVGNHDQFILRSLDDDYRAMANWEYAKREATPTDKIFPHATIGSELHLLWCSRLRPARLPRMHSFCE
jgi:hypothetical protein